MTDGLPTTHHPTLRSILLCLLLCLAGLDSCRMASTGSEGSQVRSSELSADTSAPDTGHRLRYTSGIRSIHQDRAGNYWFGSNSEGVSRHEGECFTYYTTADGLSNDQIRSIHEDDQGAIWLRTGHGISKFDGETFSIESEKAIVPVGLDLRGEWPVSSQGLWIGNGDRAGSVYHYDGRRLTKLDFPVLPQDHESFSIAGAVTGISKGAGQRVWISSYGGVIGVEGRTFIYINDRQYDYHVRSIHEDRQGRLWIGNNGIGVLLYEGGETSNFTIAQGLNDPNGQTGGTRSPVGTLNHVFAIAEDAQGTIWFGDRDSGAWAYDGERMTNYTLKDGLTDLFVTAIHCDRQGDLWCGTDDGGLFLFREGRFERMYE